MKATIRSSSLGRAEILHELPHTLKEAKRQVRWPEIKFHTSQPCQDMVLTARPCVMLLAVCVHLLSRFLDPLSVKAFLAVFQTTHPLAHSKPISQMC